MFKTFPEFSKLTLLDKREYEAFISQFPPISEISFATVMTWWNVLDSAAVAVLNGNLVISYWLPGDEKNSGLSLIGTSKTDESICTMLDYLKEKGEPARLVHVCEFVIHSLRYPELFHFTDERDYDEYLLEVGKLYPYPLSAATRRIRAQVRRVFARIDEDQVTLRSLDLGLRENKELLCELSRAWWPNGTFGQSPQQTQETLETLLRLSEQFGIESICLYVEGSILGFFLYRPTHDTRYAIANYARVSDQLPGLSELLVYSCVKFLAEKGYQYVNFDLDLGLSMPRSYQLTLGSSEFFRKYTVESAQSAVDVLN